VPLDTDNAEETEEDLGELNAESYAVKDMRGEPLRLKDIAKVTLADALMVSMLWVFWKEFVLLVGYSALVQLIVIVMVFVDVYLLRRNVRSQTGNKAGKTKYTRYDDSTS
jgi:hypothetical protein